MINDNVRNKILSSLTSSVNNGCYPRKFDSDKKYYERYCSYHNCYAYAMGLKINILYNYLLRQNGIHIFEPGVISAFKSSYNKEHSSLIESVYADCDALGLEFNFGSDNNVSSEEMKIAIYEEPDGGFLSGGDFHFARLNVDGWSHVPGFGYAPERLTEKDVANMERYNFLGIYSLKKKR